MYRISATIIKSGGMPVTWVRYVHSRMSKLQCVKMFYKVNHQGKLDKERVKLIDFSCEKVVDEDEK